MASQNDRRLIPGEHDASTFPPSEPAIVGTTGFGADLPATADPTVDDEIARRSRWEGGGKTTQPQADGNEDSKQGRDRT
jgi:hypothetical protein